MDILKTSTDRDRQVKIGASNASQLCDRCLADDMLGIPQKQSDNWLQAVIGTAVHHYAEHRLLNEPTIREKYPDVRPEYKMVLGEIEGYGEVRSTSDIYFEAIKGVGDYKTTDRKKLKSIRKAVSQTPTQFDSDEMMATRTKLTMYLNQLMLYGLGYENAGFEVQTVSLLFVCRDGGKDDDLFTHTVPYDRDRALLVFDRAKRLWEFLKENPDGVLDSDPFCWYCNNRR